MSEKDTLREEALTACLKAVKEYAGRAADGASVDGNWVKGFAEAAMCLEVGAPLPQMLEQLNQLLAQMKNEQGR